MPSASTGQQGTTPPRPRQATWAAVLIIAGSVLGVLFTFQRVANLGSLELRRSYEELVAEPPLSGAGVTADTFIEIVRILSLVVGGAATASAILGIYVLQRSRSARLGLSILAPIVFLGGLMVGDLVLMVVAFGVMMLWLHPISDWYAGRPIPEQPARRGARGGAGAGGSGFGGSAPRSAHAQAVFPDKQQAPSSVQAPPPTAPAYPGVPPAQPGADPETAPGAQPGPTPGFGQGPTARTAYPAYAPDGTVVAATRPRQVLVASILTWVACGLTLFTVGLSALVVFAAPDTLLDEAMRQQPELRDQGITTGALQAAVGVLAAVLVPWCLFVVVAASLALKRVGWARTSVLVSAVVAAVISLVVTVFSLGAGGAGLVTLALSLTTVSLLVRPEVRAWFAAPRS